MEIDLPTLEMLGLNPGSPSFRLAAGRSTSRVHLASAGSRGAPYGGEDRRRGVRLAPEHTRWSDAARLRPGFEARVVDIGSRGALIEVPARLHIGGRAELCLVASDTGERLDLPGTVRRCQVASLRPLAYRGAIEFDAPIELGVLVPFAVRPVLTA